MKKILMTVAVLALTVAVGGCVEYTSTRDALTSESEVPETSSTTAPSETSGTAETAETSGSDSNSGAEDPFADDRSDLEKLREIAFDESAKSFNSPRVNYMFPSDDDGNRKMGDVFAYYVAYDFAGSTAREFTEDFIRVHMPELEDRIETAEEIEEEGSFALGIELVDESFVFWPDEDMGGITVIYSSKKAA